MKINHYIGLTYSVLIIWETNIQLVSCTTIQSCVVRVYLMEYAHSCGLHYLFWLHPSNCGIVWIDFPYFGELKYNDEYDKMSRSSSLLRFFWWYQNSWLIRVKCFWIFQFWYIRVLGKFDGILPKGPYPPCLRMADRALFAGYTRIRVVRFTILHGTTAYTEYDEFHFTLFVFRYIWDIGLMMMELIIVFAWA